MEGVRTAGADIEHIHRMRVATRRLRAALPLFAACLPAKRGKAWEGEIRQITRALGAARDADVQIDTLLRYYRTLEDPTLKPGVARLLLRLRQQRAGLQPGVVAALDRFSLSQTLPAMREALLALGSMEAGLPFSRALYQHADESIEPRLSEFLSYDEAVRRPEMVAELHAMRIAAKRLRYTLETFAPLYAGGLKQWLTSIREVQEMLGNIHDCDVWGSFLPVFIEEERARTLGFYGTLRPFRRLEPGLQAYLADRKALRERHYAGFIAAWEAWQRKGFWLELGRAVQAPLQRLHG